MTSRARQLVKQASEQAVSSEVRSWLFEDSRGFWEKTAQELIQETNEAMLKAKADPKDFLEKQNEYVVAKILLLAVTSRILKDGSKL